MTTAEIESWLPYLVAAFALGYAGGALLRIIRQYMEKI